MKTPPAGIWFAAPWLLACSGRSLDLGSNDGGASDTAPPQTAQSIAGTWNGYIETVTFPDGTDVVTATFASQPDGSYTGTVLFGTTPMPPPPVDPNVGYPPGVAQYSSAVQVSHAQFVSETQYLETFLYTARNISFDGVRLRFGLASYELWAVWCALQTQIYATVPDSVFGESPPYSCLPTPVGLGPESGGVFPCVVPDPDAGWVPVDCGKFDLCVLTFVCACTATSCASDPTVDILFDMQINGDQLEGASGETILARSWTLYGTPVGVHLTRSH